MAQIGRNKPRSLTLATYNANGLRNQRDLVRDFLTTEQVDILLVQETFLKPSIRDPKIPNYRIVRHDRATQGGGTLIYYRSSLHCMPLDTPPLENVEVSACRLAMTGHQPLVIVSAYLACQKPLLENDLKVLFDLAPAVIIAGDLNCKNSQWNCNSTNPNGRALVNISDSLLFDILAPMTPTRYPPNRDWGTPNTLDLALFKGITLQLRSIETADDIDSDHRPVLLKLGPQLNCTQQTKTAINWMKLGESLKSTSSQDLDRIPDPITSPQDTELAIEALTSHLQSALRDSSKQVPVEDDRHLSLPSDVKELLREKRAASRLYDRVPSEENRVKYRTLHRELRERIQEVREQRWASLMSEIEPTHQAYWRLARSLKSDTLSVIPALERPDHTQAFDDEEKAECLAESLELQCSPTTVNIDPSHLAEVDAEVERRSSLPVETTLEPVTAKEVQDLITSLKPRKAPGADGVNNRVLKYLPAHLILILVSIFNAAIENCFFPAIWKEADVIGIHKPGKPTNKPSSYRPISLLSAMSKLYERVILSRLKKVVITNKLLPDEQFGFRTKHSCIHQVHRITEHILANFAHRPRPIGTAALFLDVAKAFDKVWHNGLIYKLYQFGVPDRLVLILRDFLRDRSFRFRVEGSRSPHHPLQAGVPQGSALSPLLFTLYTSDIPKTPGVEIALFADDTALYASDPNRAWACAYLQMAVNALGDWFRKWRIEVNPEKSAAMFFTPGALKSSKRAGRRPTTISLYGRPIPWAKKTRYLGLILDQNLRFNHHISTVRNRALFILGRLAPLINARSKMSLRHKVTLYKTCIRPVMTYASVVFGHAKPTHLNKLQTVQNSFMRRAVGAPRYMRNVDLHRDLELPSIKNYITSLSRKYFYFAKHHSNPLIVSAANYKPLRRAAVRRPRNVLTDKVDVITKRLDRSRPPAPVPAPTARTSGWHGLTDRRRRRRIRRHQNRRVARPPRDAATRSSLLLD